MARRPRIVEIRLESFRRGTLSTETEELILRAAAEVLERGGVEALTTRAVCDAAGVKSPTLYHYFGGKDGLAAALARRGMMQFMAKKRGVQQGDDPMQQLRDGWNVAIDFALRHPALHALYTQQLRTQPELAADAFALMRSNVQRLVDRGVFKGGVDEASRAIWAASSGVLAMVSAGHKRREVEATGDTLFEAVVTHLGATAA